MPATVRGRQFATGFWASPDQGRKWRQRRRFGLHRRRQIVIGFLPGAFDVAGRSSVSVEITPVSPCPHPRGLQFATNTYLITGNAPLVKAANLVLVYSNLELDSSNVYTSTNPDGPWTNLGSSQQAQFWTIRPANGVKTLGYFAAGYPSDAISQSGPNRNQLLPAAVAILISAVLLAGLPIAIMRRRHPPSGSDDDTTD